MRRSRAPFAFVAIAIALTWLSAALFGANEPSTDSPASALLHASLVYALVVGWQPLVAFALVRRRSDAEDIGLRPAKRRSSAMSIALAIGMLVGAVLVDALLETARSPAALRSPGVELSWEMALGSTAALVGVVAVLWLQAIAEELTWRGYLLPRLMSVLGPWPGLVVHGAFWGLCYAPVLAFGSAASAERTIAFVITCSLVGVVLGWLRLSSGSIFASAASNATLTLCAGLPLVLEGVSSATSAVFEPAGWLPLVAVVVLIATVPSWRSAVTVPLEPIPDHVN